MNFIFIIITIVKIFIFEFYHILHTSKFLEIQEWLYKYDFLVADIIVVNILMICRIFIFFYFYYIIF